MRAEFVSIAEAARRLGVARSTVYARIWKRRLKSRKIGGRTFVVWEAASEIHT